MTVIESPVLADALPDGCWIPPRAVDETGPEPTADRLPDLDDMEQRCWHVFLESSTRLLEMLNRRLVDAHQLTMFDFLVLDLLAKSPHGSARMGDLAQALVIGPSRITQQIQRLESEGLVRRSRSSNDGRGVIASIGREGRARVRIAANTYGRDIRRHYLDQMSRNQMIAMGDSCRRVSAALEGAEGSERRVSVADTR